MIYNNGEYKIRFYYDQKTKSEPVFFFICVLPDRFRAKIFKYLTYLKSHEGIWEFPYTSHVDGKIRELRIDFGRNRYRILYFIFVKRNIILLHVFRKNTAKIPGKELRIAENRYIEVLNNSHFYTQ